MLTLPSFPVWNSPREKNVVLLTSKRGAAGVMFHFIFGSNLGTAMCIAPCEAMQPGMLLINTYFNCKNIVIQMCSFYVDGH